MELLCTHVVFQLLRNPLQVIHFQLLLLLRVHQLEHGPATILREGISHFVGDQGEEGFEVDPLACQILSYSGDGIIDYFVLAVKPEGAGSIENIRDIALSMIIAVEIEHFEEFFAMFFGEDRVFGNHISGKDNILVLFCVFFPTMEHLQNITTIIL